MLFAVSKQIPIVYSADMVEPKKIVVVETDEDLNGGPSDGGSLILGET